MTHNTKSIDDRVKPYYNQFIGLAHKCNVLVNESELRIEIRKGNDEIKYYAVTYPFLNTIVVNQTKYDRLAPIYQEQVILHELGHALLDLKHNEDGLNLMNAIGFIYDLDYKQYYDYYVRRLFKDCNYRGKFKYGKD